MAISVWAVVCAIGLSYGGIAMLVGDSVPGLSANLFMAGLAGAVAGFSMVRGQISWLKRATVPRAKNTLASASKSTAKAVVFGKSVVGALIGTVVGLFSALPGSINFIQFLFGSPIETFQISRYPIMRFLSGGFGGPNPPPTFFSLLFLALVVIAVAVLCGLVAGLMIHFVLHMVAGSAVGGTRGYIRSIISDDDNPIVTGLKRGALVGLGIGILQAIFTAIGASEYYHPDTSSRRLRGAQLFAEQTADVRHQKLVLDPICHPVERIKKT